MLLTFASAPHKHRDQLSFEIKPGKVHTHTQHDSAACSISDTHKHMLTHTHTLTLKAIYTHTISLIS